MFAVTLLTGWPRRHAGFDKRKVSSGQRTWVCSTEF